MITTLKCKMLIKDNQERTLVFIAAMEGHDRYLHQILLRPEERARLSDKYYY